MYTETYINNYLEHHGITHQRDTQDIDYTRLRASKYHLPGDYWTEWLETVLCAFLDPDRTSTHFNNNYIYSIKRVACSLYTNLDYGYLIYKELTEKYPSLLRVFSSHIFTKL